MTSASDNLAALVDDMLQDAGCGQDAELRDALLSLGTMASLPVPAPTGELAALLTAGEPQEQPVVPPRDELARRRRRHRPTALGLVLVAGMGLGVGGVAASTTAPEGNAIRQLLEEWAPWSRPAADASAAGEGAGGTRAGYRAPEVAADGEPASTAAPGGAADPTNLASRLLRGPAGLSGNFPPCTAPLRHDAETGPAKCGGNGAPGIPAQGNGSGSAKDTAGPAGDGVPAAPGLQGPAKAEPLAASTPAGAPGPTGAGAQKPGGSTGNAGQGQPQSQTQGGSPGNAQKGASPAK